MKKRKTQPEIVSDLLHKIGDLNYKVSCRMDTNIKSAERTKVALYIIFSKPRLVNDAPDPFHALAKPLPFDWSRIIATRTSDNII